MSCCTLQLSTRGTVCGTLHRPGVFKPRPLPAVCCSRSSAALCHAMPRCVVLFIQVTATFTGSSSRRLMASSLRSPLPHPHAPTAAPAYTTTTAATTTTPTIGNAVRERQEVGWTPCREAGVGRRQRWRLLAGVRAAAAARRDWRLHVLWRIVPPVRMRLHR